MKVHVASLLYLSSSICWSQIVPYPDQFHTVEGTDSLLFEAVAVEGIMSDAEGDGIRLQDDHTRGTIILKARESGVPFNRGLPSWNGISPHNNSAFRVFLRFPQDGEWSPWLTVGFWKNNLWSDYGATDYEDGWVDIDYVKLDEYVSEWQFKVEFKRTTLSLPSPTLQKLSFFSSDTRTTQQTDYEAILRDNPEGILIPTTFYHQYSLDSEIGHRICSPTCVSMVLQSFNMEVDPVDFAWDTYDPYYHIFGVWPRVVQNASEYGLTGYVARYRSWSETREVLARGGRIVMSLGSPLYATSGHLAMLAGFDASGNPIVHDPARTDGYAYVHDKSDLSHSWFDKGGIAYTFFQRSSQLHAADKPVDTPGEYRLIGNYPNPFNPATTIHYELPERTYVGLNIHDILGRRVRTLVQSVEGPGYRSVVWDGNDDLGQPVSAGVYLCTITAGNLTQSRKMILLR